MNNIITRGFDLQDSNIVTQGFSFGEIIPPIIPQVGGGKVVYKKHQKKYFELFIKIKGTKCFVIRLFYKVIGTVKVKLEVEVDTVAKLLSETNINYNLQGIESQLVENSIEILGQSLHKLLENLECFGLQSQQIDLVSGITGKKSFVVDKEAFIEGIKKIVLNQENKIKGTRDITTILSSLGLITEEE